MKVVRAIGVALLVVVTTGCSGSSTPPSGPAGEKPVRTWRTWIVASPSQLDVPPPPVPGSAAAKRDRTESARLANHPPADAASAIRRFGVGPAIRPWVELNLALVSGRSIVDPPFASRSYALVSAAMNDAVVACRYWDWRYDRPSPGAADGSVPDATGTYPSETAVVAGAASRVLAFLFRNGDERSFDWLAERAAWSRVWSGVERPSGVEAGLALGRAIAGRAIARAQTDGYARVWDGRRPHGARFWAPPTGTAIEPVQPLAGAWRTWALRSGSQFRAPAPPRYGSPTYVAQARELIRLHRKLTAEQKRTAKFWEGNVGSPLPPGVWNEVALAYVQRDALDTAHAARVFALLNIAMADAGVATWDTKFAYWTARPENAIRDLGLARDWKPFLATPPFPSYVSAHSAYSAAAAEVLSQLFPRDAVRFRAKAEEAGLSRLYGGIHFRSDHVAGVELGRQVGRLVLQRAARSSAR